MIAAILISHLLAPGSIPDDMISRVRIEVQTGNDDKKDYSAVYFSMSGFPDDAFLFSRKGETLADRTRKSATWNLSSPKRLNSIRGFRIKFEPGAVPGLINNWDKWHLMGIRVYGLTSAGSSYEIYDDMKELSQELTTNAPRWESRDLGSGSFWEPYRNRQIEATITSGEDGFRYLTSHAMIYLIWDNCAESRVGFYGYGSHKTKSEWTSNVSDAQLQRVEIVFHETFKGGLFDQVDNWDVAQFRISAPAVDTRADLFDSRNVGRLVCGNVWQSAQLRRRKPLPDVSRNPSISLLTANDDLRSDSSVTAGVQMGDGTKHVVQIRGLKDRSFEQLTLLRSVPLNKIKHVFLVFDRGGNDTWAVKGLCLNAVQLPYHEGRYRIYDNWNLNLRLSRGQTWRSPVLPTFVP